MSGTYAGNPTALTPLITLIADSDAPSGAVFSTPLEQIADRTAGLVPDVQTFTANGTWTKPATAWYVEFTLVGPGGPGSPGVGGSGGLAGAAGQIVHALFPAAVLPATLTVTVGPAPVTFGTGVDTTLAEGTSAFTLVAAHGNNSAAAAATGISPGTTGVNNSVGGGVGGFRGGGSVGTGGKGGKGAGAGGGGGGSAGGIGSSAGGNGGDGGYGFNVPGVTAAVDGGNGGASAGASGAGASGVVIITTWRKPL